MWLLSIPLLVFACGVVFLRWAQRPRADRRIQQRLRAISRIQPGSAAAQKAETLELEGRKDRNARVGEALAGHTVTAWIPGLLRESGSTWTVFRLLASMLLCALPIGALAAFFQVGAPLAAACAGFGSSAPVLVLRWKRKRRLARFEGALPEAIDLISRALQAGNSVQQAIEVASEQAPTPVRTELALVHQELSLGLPLRDTLLSLLGRVPSQDLRFCVTAILLQRQTGGDLVHILDRTAYTIRERLRVEGEVKTFTAQGRLASAILTALPVVLFGLTFLLTPAYAAVLLHDPTGQRLLWVGTGLLVVGGFLVRRATKVEV